MRYIRGLAKQVVHRSGTRYMNLTNCGLIAIHISNTPPEKDEVLCLLCCLLPAEQVTHLQQEPEKEMVW